MDSVLDGGGQLEREMRPDPIAAPVTGSIVLHALLFGGVIFYAIFNGFHHNWGAPGAGSAIQVSLDSAVLPLPSDQPKTDNVLPTEKPSPAPVPPAPKAKEAAVDQQAIPIQGKEVKQEKQKPAPPKPQTKQPPPKPDSRVQYGEQAGQKLSRSTFAQQTASDQPVSVTNGDFGTRFGWYVDGIKRKVAQNWYRSQIDPRTPKNAVVSITFKINRDGNSSGYRISTASGSPTLDRSCLLATQRTGDEGGFGPLPRESTDQWIDVTYDCTY